MTLLKDLIDIPEHIDKGQFVLRLTEGVTDPQATVAAYVPTPQLVLAFDDALNFIKGSVLGHTSKATYLHGSFGSGKSHFMAILHLILSGNASARAIPELAATIQKHNSWIEGKKFLLVPYHMIAAHDVESGIRSLVRNIANPLQLGEMGHDATHFVLGHHWRNHINRKAAEASSTISVGQLRKWIDQPRAMGLPKEAQNLVILTYAEQTNQTFYLHNTPDEVSLTKLPDDYILRQGSLPDEAHWAIAVDRASRMFGEVISPLLKATTVANLSAALKKKSTEVRSSCVTLHERLKERLSRLGVDPADSRCDCRQPQRLPT